MPLATPDDRRILEVYLATRSTAGSRATARSYLRICARALGYDDETACPWSRLTYADIVLLRDKLNHNRLPSTVNSYIMVVRGLLHQARKMRLIDADAYADMVDVPTLPEDTDRPSAGRALTHDEYTRLLAACDDDISRGVALRDRAILTMLWTTGVRARTLLAVALADVDLDGCAVKVRAKGNKRKTLPMSAECVTAIRRYLVRRGEWAGPLFVAASSGRPPHKLTRQALGYHGLSAMLERRVAEAGLDHLTAHDFRRTAISEWIDVVGLRAAQLMAMHSSPAQTAQYDRHDTQRMLDAIKAREEAHRKDGQSEHDNGGAGNGAAHRRGDGDAAG